MKRLLYVAILAIFVGLLAFQVSNFLAKQLPVEAAAGLRVAGTQEVTPTSAAASGGVGVASYEKNCAICHGERREGILPAFPPLAGIEHRMTEQQISDLIHKGKGRMPGFPKLENPELAGLLRYLSTADTGAPETAAGGEGKSSAVHSNSAAEAGGGLFQQNCAFCHGRDAMGGETGPDLTQSKLVLADVDGSKISEVVRNGRIEKKMPAFNFSGQELASLVAFIREREVAAVAMKGNRRGVAISDLQTGNLQKGKQYFNGGGNCAKCHSPTGDLAGIATRYQGLRLEERMLYPGDAKSRVNVTLPSGQTVEGVLAYLDEFTVGLRDKDGVYHSWLVKNVKYKVDSPAEAHVEQFPKYTDDDIHNLMAYLQTLR